MIGPVHGLSEIYSAGGPDELTRIKLLPRPFQRTAAGGLLPALAHPFRGRKDASRQSVRSGNRPDWRIRPQPQGQRGTGTAIHLS